MKGVIKEAARRLFNTEVVIKVKDKKQEHGDSLLTEHVTLSITQVCINRSI